ncbi:MAG: protease complex subunit PrcB family protein [Bacillota bacterium]
MSKKIIGLLSLVLMAVLMLTGCGINTEGKTAQAGQLSFEVIQSDKLPAEAANWYQDNFRVDGLHSFTVGGDRYLLLSVGEKPTGGYAIGDLTLIGTEKEIEVKAKLRSPKSGDMVTMALTYPHVLIKLKEDGRQLRFGGVQGNDPIKAGAAKDKQDSGTYIGQIDNNSIEIKVSGVQDPKEAHRAFRLSEEVKSTFDSYKLNTGDEVLFTYTVNEHNQQVITKIDKIKR